MLALLRGSLQLLCVGEAETFRTPGLDAFLHQHTICSAASACGTRSSTDGTRATIARTCTGDLPGGLLPGGLLPGLRRSWVSTSTTRSSSSIEAVRAIIIRFSFDGLSSGMGAARCRLSMAAAKAFTSAPRLLVFLPASMSQHSGRARHAYAPATRCWCAPQLSQTAASHGADRAHQSKRSRRAGRRPARAAAAAATSSQNQR